jgi:hypothetical protein
MAKKKQEVKKEQKGYSFHVKNGDNTITYTFNVKKFSFDRLTEVNVEDLFDDKGQPKKESAAILQKLVKINSGILNKEG